MQHQAWFAAARFRPLVVLHLVKFPNETDISVPHCGSMMKAHMVGDLMIC